MISLILTLFISVFSIGSANYRLEDQKENTNVCEISESPSVKNYGYIDESGIQLALFPSDFASDYFIINFINGLSQDEASPTYRLNFGDLNAFNCDLASSGYFCPVEYSVIQWHSNNIVNIPLIRVKKSNANQYPTGNYEFTYQLQFFNSSLQLYAQYSYTIAVPCLDDREHDFDINCLRVFSDTYPSLGGGYWAYFENTNDGVCPLVQYFQQRIVNDRVDTINTNYNRGFEYGKTIGYQEGYRQGIEDIGSYDTVANSIMLGIFDVGLLPVNVFLTIFNFELFGVNIAGIISGILTLSVVIIIMRMLLGGKDNDK